MIQTSTAYVTSEGIGRDTGITDNSISRYLAGTLQESMRTDDFMFYYADIFVEGV